MTAQTIDRADLEQQLADDVVTAYMASINSPKVKELPIALAVARTLIAMGWDKPIRH